MRTLWLTALLGVLPLCAAGCSTAGPGHPHAAPAAQHSAPQHSTADDELFLTMVRGTGGRSVAGFGDEQLVRAAWQLCVDLRNAGGGPQGVRAEPTTPSGLAGASPSALAAVTGWGEWIYCPDLALPH